MKIQPLSPSFNAGELSERLSTRVDFAKYPSGVEIMENMIPLPEGGAMRRGGTRFIKELKSSGVKGRLKKFQFSTTQAYQIEMGEQMFRFYRNQAQITANNIADSITNGTFDSGITSWTDRSGASSSISHDAGNTRMSITSNGTTDGHAEQQVTSTSGGERVLRFRVYGAPGDYLKLRVGTSSKGTEIVNDFKAYVGWHTYAFDVTGVDFYVQFLHTTAKTLQVDDVSLIDNAPIELTTPYTEAQIPKVDGPQSADVLYLFHVAHPTYKLERRGHTTWSLVEVAWQDGPYLDENTTATTMTAGAATGLGVTFTASAVTGINNDEGFKTTDVGRLIRLTDEATVNWGWGVITGFTSTTAVTVDIKRTVVSTVAETRWALGAWSATDGYPSCGAFFEQRMFAANNGDQPQTFWASQTSDIENMAPDSDPTAGTWDGTVQDDDAFVITISANDVNAIFWMSAGEDTLAMGTAGGEWIPSATNSGTLAPSNIAVRRQITRQSADLEPVRVDNVVLFIQRGKRKILEFGFTFESDGYEGFDMTRLAEHITRGGVEEMDYAEEPDSIVWGVRNDGQLLSMTFRRKEDVVAWGRHIIGGSFGSGNSVVESVSTIPGTNGSGQTQDSTNRDEVWLIVKRTINGETKRYIEMFERDFETGDDQEDAYYLDSLVTYDSTSTTAMTGLDHLEGETVGVWADGAIQDDKTVSGGAVTLDIASSVAQMGLRYTHKLKTLKFEGGNAAGTSIGKTKRVVGVTFVLLNSHTITFGPDADNLETHEFRDVSDPLDAGAPLFTGEKYYAFDGGWDTDARILIQNDDPAPFTLLAIAPTISLNALK